MVAICLIFKGKITIWLSFKLHLRNNVDFQVEFKCFFSFLVPVENHLCNTIDFWMEFNVIFPSELHLKTQKSHDGNSDGFQMIQNM